MEVLTLFEIINNYINNNYWLSKNTLSPIGDRVVEMGGGRIMAGSYCPASAMYQ